MPYSIQRRGRCYSVINTKTKQKKSKCTSRTRAQSQARLLRAVEHGWKPRKSKSKSCNCSMKSRVRKNSPKK